MRSKARWIAVAVLAAVMSFPPVVPAARASSPLEVEVEAGLLRGVDAGATFEWRGIPYAEAPTGALRWRPPVSKEPWSGVRDATEFAPPCIQLRSDTETHGQEDCLYLNVFAPASTTPSSPLPVMVHLHGGGNFFGWPYMNASAFVSHGVIVVTVGYRLGAMGFLAHPALSEEGGGASGEYALLDQLAALQWVQDNISAFGGDPGNVTLFGMSAGSFDALALVASPLGHGLFQRAALQTTNYWSLYEPPTLAEVEQDGQRLADMVGCSASSDVADCLRALPADQLVLTLGPGDVQPLIGGQVLTASPRDLIAAQEATVPLLVGSTREEASILVFHEFTLGGRRYPKGFYQLEAIDIIAPDAARAVRELYPVHDYDSELWAGIAIWSDSHYTCPARALASTSAGPVWRYLYTHVYDNSEFLAGARAAHFFDDPVMWLDAELSSLWMDYEFSPDEIELSANMRGYWTNFAKTGDPNGPGVPEWPQWSPTSQPTLVLDEPIGLVERWHDIQCDFFDTYPIFIKPGWYSSGKFPPGIPYPGAR
jgi:para-nitrobenzyl esterase